MAFKISFSFFPIAFLLPLISVLANEEGKPQFSYVGETGPEKWGSLNPNFTACSMGKKQSPINISKDEYVLDKNLKPLIGDYYPVNANLTNHVYNIGLFYDADAGSIEIDGTSYALKQMHWHSPSEHQIDGEQFPLELHLVHKTSDGKLAVVAILFRIGAPNPLLARLRRPLAMLAKGEVAQIPVGNLGAKHVRRIAHRYYRYIGSYNSSLFRGGCLDNPREGEDRH